MVCLLTAFCCYSQGRMILNGATVTISNGAFLVVDNSAANAITRSSGHIISEGENNRVKWNIGTAAGSYAVPFGYSGSYLPVSFSKNSGTGSGSFIFSTYHTTWKNSDYLPAGVTNMVGQMPDHSAWALDRFWQVSAEGYATKPSLSNLTFTYLDIEHQAAGNNIIEGYLGAQQWNNTQNKWDDVQAGGFTNTVSNTITVASVPSTAFYKWWSLTDQLYPLPVKLLNFTAMAAEEDVELKWSATAETAGIQYLLQRSKEGSLFENIATKDGHVTPGENHYQFTDTAAYSGRSFYRIKLIERGGASSFSPVRNVWIKEPRQGFRVYPNPVLQKTFTLQLPAALQAGGLLVIFNQAGTKVAAYSVKAAQEKMTVHLPSSLPAGTYMCQLQTGKETMQQTILVY